MDIKISQSGIIIQFMTLVGAYSGDAFATSWSVLSVKLHLCGNYGNTSQLND